MVHMVEGTAMNLSFMMLEQIKSTAGKAKTKACLPYDMVFTLVFVDAGIDLDGEDFKSLTHTDYYTIHTLHRMKYQKVGDELVRKVQATQPHDSESSFSSPSDFAESSSPAPALDPHLLH